MEITLLLPRVVEYQDLSPFLSSFFAQHAPRSPRTTAVADLPCLLRKCRSSLSCSRTQTSPSSSNLGSDLELHYGLGCGSRVWGGQAMAWWPAGFGGGGGEDLGGDAKIWVEDLEAASGGRIWRVQGRGFVAAVGRIGGAREGVLWWWALGGRVA